MLETNVDAVVRTIERIGYTWFLPSWDSGKEYMCDGAVKRYFPEIKDSVAIVTISREKLDGVRSALVSRSEHCQTFVHVEFHSTLCGTHPTHTAFHRDLNRIGSPCWVSIAPVSPA